jgi:hypothetical protein
LIRRLGLFALTDHGYSLGDVEGCAKHFANAIGFADRPEQLFLYLQQSLPEELFMLVAHNVDPEVMRDKYVDWSMPDPSYRKALQICLGPTSLKLVS